MRMNIPLKTLRNRKTRTAEFRAASRTVGAHLMRKLAAIMRKKKVPHERVVLVIILRASIALLEPALRAFPGASVGVLGLRRDPRTFAPIRYYENLPPLSKRDTVVILDPMLATGGSAEAAVLRLVERGADPKKICFLGVVAAPVGLARLMRRIPRENIVLGAVDRGLTARKLIVPGLGDFGDRYFGYARARGARPAKRAAAPMTLASPAFNRNEQIPTRYTGDGEDIHPPLAIARPPKRTKSFCLIMEDLDVQEGGWNYLHWTMWNIHPHTTLIKAGKVPPGVVQGKTSAGVYHYVGPCPPKGIHRYRFMLFALDKELDVDPDSNAEDLEEEMDGHVLAQAELVGTYHRDGDVEWQEHTEDELGPPPPRSQRTPPPEPGYVEEE